MIRKTSTAKDVAPPAQDPLEMLKTACSKSEADQSHHGACCILLDHWQELRQRFGYGCLYDLRRQLGQVLESLLGSEVQACVLNDAGIVALVPAGQPLAEAGESLFRGLTAHEFMVGEEAIAITVSVGVCPLARTAEAADKLLVRLVTQAEALRENGGNQLAFPVQEAADQTAVQEQKDMLGLLMQSLRDDTLRVVFQPLLPTAGEEVRSFQMLPRLKGPKNELIPAAEFLPVARSAGLVATLDRWMLTTAVQMLERRYRNQNIRLFLSQSEALLAEAGRRERLARQLESARNLAGHLVMDFRLADAMAHLKGTEALIAVLEQAGLEICFSMVDDHSNWDLLSGRLNCDYVRMSPDYVRALASSSSLEKHLERLSKPARAAGIKVILPMIEDANAAATLWRKGVDFLQGNLIQAAEESIEFTD